MLIGKSQTILKLEENLSPYLPLNEKGYSRHKSDEINKNGFDYILKLYASKYLAMKRQM